jgi:hypothetical protein
MDKRMKDVIVDLDGTVADIQHRVHHIEKPNGRKNYRKFFEECNLDTPIPEIIQLVEMLAPYHNIIFCTGRSKECELATVEWITNHIKISGFQLLMKEENDRRCDTIAKPELLEKAGIKHENIALILEDRNKVVNKWNELGLPCIQVLEGQINPIRGDF